MDPAKKTMLRALLHAIAVTVYVMVVVFLITSLEGMSDVPDYMAGVAMLLLFSASAAICGFLIFGKPVMLYIDGKKTEAVGLVSATIGWLFLFALLVLLIAIVFG